MDRHFHIIAGNSQGAPYADARYDNYEESIDKVTSLSVGLFGHLFEGDEALTIEKFIDATEHGEGQAIMVGTPRLCICWWPCDECKPLVSN